MSVSGYRPFGLPLEGDGGEPYGYTGEWSLVPEAKRSGREDDAGLVYLRARYMQPGTGRFISRDPWPGSVWQPGTLNRFVYAANSPLRFVDPSGNQSCDCDELWEELRSNKCRSWDERVLWDWYFGIHRQKYLEWVSLHKKEALAAARRYNLPELMGVPEDEVAARMLAYKWTNFTAGYLQDALEAIATQVGIGKGSRSMTVFELRPEEVDDLRRGYIRYLGDQAPFEPQYGAGEWEWAFARPQRRMMDSQFLLSHPRSEELIEFAATQVAHGTYAYHRKWSEYSLFAADMALDPEGSTPPIPWPLLSADNFLINWVSNGGSASLPDEPGRESDALLERWNFLADRPNHTAYIVPGLYQVFGVESDCPCGGLVPYDSEADRMPQVSIEYGPSYQPPLYLPVPLKQY